MDNAWNGFIAQVRERYLAGELNLDQFVRDLQAAVLLDEGIRPPRGQIPLYLRDRFGWLLTQ